MNQPYWVFVVVCCVSRKGGQSTCDVCMLVGGGNGRKTSLLSTLQTWGVRPRRRNPDLGLDEKGANEMLRSLDRIGIQLIAALRPPSPAQTANIHHEIELATTYNPAIISNTLASFPCFSLYGVQGIRVVARDCLLECRPSNISVSFPLFRRIHLTSFFCHVVKHYLYLFFQLSVHTKKPLTPFPHSTSKNPLRSKVKTRSLSRDAFPF